MTLSPSPISPNDSRQALNFIALYHQAAQKRDTRVAGLHKQAQTHGHDHDRANGSPRHPTPAITNHPPSTPLHLPHHPHTLHLHLHPPLPPLPPLHFPHRPSPRLHHRPPHLTRRARERPRRGSRASWGGRGGGQERAGVRAALSSAQRVAQVRRQVFRSAASSRSQRNTVRTVRCLRPRRARLESLRLPSQPLRRAAGTANERNDCPGVCCVYSRLSRSPPLRPGRVVRSLCTGGLLWFWLLYRLKNDWKYLFVSRANNTDRALHPYHPARVHPAASPFSGQTHPPPLVHSTTPVCCAGCRCRLRFRISFGRIRSTRTTTATDMTASTRRLSTTEPHALSGVEAVQRLRIRELWWFVV